jgi:hypothetical protein
MRGGWGWNVEYGMINSICKIFTFLIYKFLYSSPMSSTIGNRITDNAIEADDGRELIERAVSEIGKQSGWRPFDEEALFSGVYYDSAKVGSFIVRVTNERGERAVLKIQLRPLTFDEGFIIRHVEKENRSKRVRLPQILADEAWNEARGYGYLITEDASQLPSIWTERILSDMDMDRHRDFLREFLQVVLPVTPWFSPPDVSPQEVYRDAFEHFYSIAKQSSHRHIDIAEVDALRDFYFKCIDRMTFEGFQFTHGHLSGRDVKYDATNDRYILFANLYWSYRPRFYEIAFPAWVALMDLRNPAVTMQDLLREIHRWSSLGSDVFGTDIQMHKQYWFNLLERSMMTIMLDLGSSEWKPDENRSKEALLRAWVDLFHWLMNEKLN